MNDIRTRPVIVFVVASVRHPRGRLRVSDSLG